MFEPKSLEERKPFDRLRVFLIGQEKSGKSWLAATAHKPVLFLDYDNRSDALSGRKGVYAISYREPPPFKQPTVFNETLDLLTKLEQSLNLHQFFPGGTDNDVNTLVVDSVTLLARSAMNYALYTSADMRRRLNIPSWNVDLPRNFDAWNAEMTTIESVILRMMALPVDLICCIHQTEEEAVDSSVEKRKFTGRIGVFPARYQLLLKHFNEVWHTEQAPDGASPSYKPRVQTRPDFRCPWAATNLLLDHFELPDISKMVEKHIARERSGWEPAVTQTGSAEQI